VAVSLQEHGGAEFAGWLAKIHGYSPIDVSRNKIRPAISIEIGCGNTLGPVVLVNVDNGWVTHGKAVAESLEVIEKLPGSLMSQA
jgi:hypothetical protein